MSLEQQVAEQLRVLALIQCWNVQDPIRGFVVDWLQSLNRHVNALSVISLEVQTNLKPESIRLESLGKERLLNLPRAIRWPFYLVNWLRLAPKILAKERPNIIFVHMTPLYALLIWPFAKIYKIPIVLWFEHKRSSLILRIATKLVHRVLSASEQGTAIRQSNHLVLGHGIDTNKFQPSKKEEDASKRPLRLITVGRIAPIKELELLIEAVALVRSQRPDLELEFMIIGAGTRTEDQEYKIKLEKLVNSLGMQKDIHFVGAKSYSEIHLQYQNSDCFIHACQSGLDKALLEAMSCALPVFTLNRIIADEAEDARTQPCLVRENSATGMAKDLISFFSLESTESRRLGARLRAFVLENHSLDALAFKLAAVLRQMAAI